ncbi:hypothetical protein PC115_g15760 [Phytophthora cactorum]|uniref:Uncharacterized protein n=1 Tax=Phytophthora cactorum TaxID=29920 RepID=A0A8T1BK01_9STRA|nr:hypothetical protein PC115_g15760 [Phytophthora cactorum]KAG3070433.1 hypothetical protein PC122_g16128 [Phytophthora cactorum]
MGGRNPQDYSKVTLSSHSSFNGMRVFIRDNPHKWGTNHDSLLYPYTGKIEQGESTDYNSGPAIVIRNLRCRCYC